MEELHLRGWCMNFAVRLIPLNVPKFLGRRYAWVEGRNCFELDVQIGFFLNFQVANILLAHAGRSGSGGITEAAAEIARAAARAWIAPLLDTACERLAFVLRNLFDIAIESIRRVNSSECKWNFFIDIYIYIYARVCVYTCTPFRLFYTCIPFGRWEKGSRHGRTHRVSCSC